MDDKIVGFDISKKFIDLAFIKCDNTWSYKKLDYTLKGLKELVNIIPKTSVCVMEATGPYYLRLATFLYERGYKISVVNPLVIRRYSQMLMKRTKTDKADAQVIAMYGKDQKPGFWKPKQKSIQRIQQINSVIESLIKERTRWTNKIEAAKQDVNFDKLSMRIMKQLIRNINRNMVKLEEELDMIIEQEYMQENRILQSIPGIGRKTSIVLLAITGGFTKFESYKQFCSYVGLSPRIYESGSSVRGKARICKLGLSRVRQLLYLCAWTAKQANKACKMLFDRLIEKGKSKKLALIAVANKLIRQAFGCIRNNNFYRAELC